MALSNLLSEHRDDCRVDSLRLDSIHNGTYGRPGLKEVVFGLGREQKRLDALFCDRGDCERDDEHQRDVAEFS